MLQIENSVLEPRIKYILEEITAVPMSDEHSVFIVYPFETSEPFILALKLLKNLELIPSHDVIWMETPIDKSSFQPHLAKPDNMKLLFQKKEKHIYFIMCPHQEFYNLKHLKVLLKLIATAITDCADLVNQGVNNEELSFAQGPWHITLIIADTLQAYNNDNYVSNAKAITKDLHNEGIELINEAQKFILSEEFIGKLTIIDNGNDSSLDHRKMKFTTGKDISVSVNIMNWEKHRNSHQRYSENHNLFCSLYLQREAKLPADLEERLTKKKVNLKEKVDELRKSVDAQKVSYETRLKRKVGLPEKTDKLYDTLVNQNEKSDDDVKKQVEKLTGLEPRDTRGSDNNCAFHAIFGKWDGKEFVCNDVFSKRKQVANNIRNCKTDSVLFNLVKEAIKALIMEGKITNSLIIKSFQDMYKNYLKLDADRMQLAWKAFDNTLQKYSEITGFINDFCIKYCAEKSIILKNLTPQTKFQICLNENAILKWKILSHIELGNAFLQYNKVSTDEFNWENIYNHPQIIDEYANFIEILGNCLLPVEVQIIGHVFKLTIDYYIKTSSNQNSAPKKIETLSQSKSPVISICFNGINHYEKMVNSNQLAINAQWEFYNNLEDDKLNKNQRIIFVKTCMLGLNPDYTLHSSIQKVKLKADEKFQFNLPDFDENLYVVRNENKELENKFAIKPTAHKETTIVVCYGEGGVGKTHLAKYYLNSSRQSYTMRIRINAESLHTISTEFNRLAENLKMYDLGRNLQLFYNRSKKPRDEDIRKALLKWFEDESNAGWLLTFDNVVDYKMVKEYMPRCGGHILITTRINEWDQHVHPIHINLMDVKQSIELLQKTSGKNDNDFITLANKLGYLPIALQIAGLHFALYPNISVKKYCENEEFINISHDKSISKVIAAATATTNISILAIDNHFKKEKGEAPFTFARNILSVCSYLASYNISKELLRHWFVKKYPSQNDKFNEVYLLLHKHSLFHEESSGCVRVHPLLQEVLRNHVARNASKNPDYSNMINETIDCLLEFSNKPIKLVYHHENSIIASHMQTILKYTGDLQTKDKIIKILIQLGKIYSGAIGNSAESNKYLIKAIDLLNSASSNQTAEAALLIAENFYVLGGRENINKAIEFANIALNIYEKQSPQNTNQLYNTYLILETCYGTSWERIFRIKQNEYSLKRIRLTSISPPNKELMKSSLFLIFIYMLDIRANFEIITLKLLLKHYASYLINFVTASDSPNENSGLINLAKKIENLNVKTSQIFLKELFLLIEEHSSSYVNALKDNPQDQVSFYLHLGNLLFMISTFSTSLDEKHSLLKKSMTSFQNSFSIWEKEIRVEHPQLAFIYYSIAQTAELIEGKEYVRISKEYYSKLLQMHIHHLGEKHPQTLEVYCRIVNIHLNHDTNYGKEEIIAAINKIEQTLIEVIHEDIKNLQKTYYQILVRLYTELGADTYCAKIQKYSSLLKERLNKNNIRPIHLLQNDEPFFFWPTFPVESTTIHSLYESNISFFNSGVVRSTGITLCGIYYAFSGGIENIIFYESLMKLASKFYISGVGAPDFQSDMKFALYLTNVAIKLLEIAFGINAKYLGIAFIAIGLILIINNYPNHSNDDIVLRGNIYTPPSINSPLHINSSVLLPFNKNLEHQIALTATLMSMGINIFILSLVVAMVNNEVSLKIAPAIIICAVTLGSYIARQKSGKIIKSTGHRFHEFFRHIEGNADRVTTAIVNTSDALINSKETVIAAINRLSKTVDESTIVLKDESKNTMIELRGIGRDLAAALKQGIFEGKFTPHSHVNASVFAAMHICNLI